MLQALRSTVGSWIVKILFVLLILSFGVWGIGDIFRGRTDTTAAQVGDVKISTVELDNAFRQEVNRLRQMLGGQIDAEQAKALGLVNQTLDQLIQRTLLSLAADDAGLRVGDPLVLGQLRAEPAFHNQLGQFDSGPVPACPGGQSVDRGRLRQFAPHRDQADPVGRCGRGGRAGAGCAGR